MTFHKCFVHLNIQVIKIWPFLKLILFKKNYCLTYTKQRVMAKGALFIINTSTNYKNLAIPLKEPLAELYAFHLYSDDKSFSREFYIKDLKRSNYYNDLLNSLEGQYSETAYPNYYKEELIKDQYPLLQSKNKNYQYIIYALAVLLVFSLAVNFIIIRKNRFSTLNKKALPIDYKTVLSPQEQKVIELIHEKLSNKEIAEKLFISLSTVKTHINNIYSKLSISSRKEIHHFF